MFNYNEIKKIHVELSTLCNAACPVCPRNVMGGYDQPYIKHNTFTFDDFLDIFDPEFISKLTQILLVGRYGDPMSCQDLNKILEYIRTHNKTVNIIIHTNGGLRNPDWWQQLASYDTNVIFSIDGLEDTNHIYRRNVNWNKLMTNVAAYINAGGIARWEFLIFKHNQHQTDRAKEYADELGFVEFIPKRPYGFNNPLTSVPAINVIDNDGKFEYFVMPGDDDFVNKPFDSEKIDLVKHDCEYNKYITTKIKSKNAHINSRSWDNKINCHAIKQKEIYIDALYNVFPCCWFGFGGQSDVLHDPEELQFVKWLQENIGIDNINAKKYSLKQIIESDYFKKIKQTWDTDSKFYTCATMCSMKNNLRKGLRIES